MKVLINKYYYFLNLQGETKSCNSSDKKMFLFFATIANLSTWSAKKKRTWKNINVKTFFSSSSPSPCFEIKDIKGFGSDVDQLIRLTPPNKQTIVFDKWSRKKSWKWDSRWVLSVYQWRHNTHVFTNTDFVTPFKLTFDWKSHLNAVLSQKCFNYVEFQ